MNTIKRTKRLHILSKREIEELFDLPNFSDEERNFYFVLEPDEHKVMVSLGSKLSRIFFILQLGYFKAKQTFFNFDLQTIQADFTFVAKTYFPNNHILPSLISQKARLNHQAHILALQGYTKWSTQSQKLMYEQALRMVRICVAPRYIFEGLVDFLNQNQVILPSYSTLQDIIGQALTTETKRLNKIVANNLSVSANQALQDMLQDEDQKMYGVTLLKRDAKGFNHAEITKEIQKQQTSVELFKAAQHLIPKLEIAEQNICHYAYLVDYYTVDRLKELSGNTANLYLLCYVYYRFEKINDNLINGFVYHLNKYKKEAHAYGKEAVYDYKVEGKHYGKEAGKILDLFTDEAIADSEPFGQVRTSAFKIVAKEKFSLLKAHVTQSFNEEAFRWDYYKTIAKTISYNLRPIIKVIEFSSHEVNHPLLQALTFLTKTWKSKKSLRQLKADQFPTACITKDLEAYVYDTVSVEGISKKVMNVNAYEFMVYDQLAKALDSGEVFVKDSFSFKSLKQDLFPDWDDNKDEVLAKLNNPVLNTPIEEQLQSFKEELEPLIVRVNQNITQGKNKEINIKPSKNDPNLKTWTLAYAKKKDEINNPFYEQLPKVNLSQILRFVNNHCHFAKAFTHVKSRFAKITEFDIEAIFAILTANATNCGIYHMAGICDIGYDKLLMTLKSLIRLETLKNANNILRKSMVDLPIFKHWDLLEQQRIAALDGKKIQTRLMHILARHSSKYFGQKRGVVSYSLNYNNMCANSIIMSPHEHESHHLYGVIYNSIIDADWYCGDTHSINQVKFALLHLLSKKFTHILKRFTIKPIPLFPFKIPKFTKNI